MRSGIRARLWVVWLLCAAGLALLLTVPRFVPPRPIPWNAGQAAVAGFVLALLSLTSGVSTFAGREQLLEEPGLSRRLMLYTIWARCLLIGVFGAVLAWGASSPGSAWPFIAGGAALMLFHAPRGVH
jgi:membrane protease YdiL (CAAX protease family)